MKKEIFLEKTEKLKPVLHHESHMINVNFKMENGDKCVIDFGNHYVGYPSIYFSYEGDHFDCPSLIKVKFCEIKNELEEDSSTYNGWISKSWIQEEIIHIDEMPCKFDFKRRYAFRYIEITAISTSSKCFLCIEKAEIDSVTSANKEIKLVGGDELDRKIDQIAIKTLKDCMQDVFEDGPKRDQRLWLGDLRLEALTNYETFKCNDLVKRCLYLFAACTKEDGKIPQSVYTKPYVAGEEKSMFDYSLLFISILNEYFDATGDTETTNELLPIAIEQISLARMNFENNIIYDSNELGWCFLDWSLELNKQAGAEAVYIYAEKDLIKLLDKLGEDSSSYKEDVKKKEEASIAEFYDVEKGLFVSGKDKQISYATNIWFVLAGVLTKDQNKEILNRLKSNNDAIKPVTPYLMHYYVEALIASGLGCEAREVMRNYWGGMVKEGADTFFELFNPNNINESPYGGKAVNSYCHAWSCTPSYFMRKYFKE